MTEDHTTTNPLIHEKSPYLLQHARNPVQWRPWGDEAFSLAKKQDKPVFLSIGYATCHWCHVMERESFEDQDVARVLNQGFIPVKVDREERPDIDGVYMTVCQMITGRGGWPLTIIMTPDKKPFFAATYLPRKGRFGQPGLLELLPEVSRVWKEERGKVTESANQVTEHLSSARWDTGGEALGLDVLNKCFQTLQERFDSSYGGFGKAPKFPAPHNLLFLLRTWKRTGNREALDMVQSTLKAMRRGGVFDHLGYGFHRYSTDERWLVPHFEKMLYDQAGMIMALTETYLATADPDYARMVQETADYVQNEMTADNGGFFSAEDADSEGEEGKFYVWTEREIESILSPEEAELVKEVFNTAADGNYKDEASGQKTGSNILHLSRPLEDTARHLNMETEELESRLSQARDRLFAARAERIRPLLDDKVLTDWNGLMIAALARAGRALGRPDTISAAEKAAGFVLDNLKGEEGRLLHRFRDGEAAIPGMLEDYVFLTFGLIGECGQVGQHRVPGEDEQITAGIQQGFEERAEEGTHQAIHLLQTSGTPLGELAGEGCEAGHVGEDEGAFQQFAVRFAGGGGEIEQVTGDEVGEGVVEGAEMIDRLLKGIGEVAPFLRRKLRRGGGGPQLLEKRGR